MPRIYVDFAGMQQIESELKQISSRVAQLTSDFSAAVGNLDWNVQYQGDVDTAANYIRGTLENQINILNEESDLVGTAYNEYIKLDNYGKQSDDGSIPSMTMEIMEDALIVTGPSARDEKEKLESRIRETIERYFSGAESVLDLLDHADVEGAGLNKDTMSYIKSFVQFFAGDKTGLSGAEDWFDLGDKSIGLWTGMYDFLKESYKNTGGIFSESAQKGVAGLGILGGIFGWTSSAFGAADNIKNSDNMGTAGIISEILGTGDGIVDIWKGIEDLEHAGDLADGLYSPAAFYAAIVKSYLAAGAQGFRSYEKYSADGTFDMDDFGRTGVEFSVSGLYKMANVLSFGLISEETTDVSPEDISNSLEDWAEEKGKDFRSFVLDHPKLRGFLEKYGGWR